MNHTIECRALLGGCAANALIRIDCIQLPVRLAVDILFEIALLRLKRICLVILVSGDPTIGCYFYYFATS